MIFTLFLIPIGFALFTAAWVWALCDALRAEREYTWIVALLFAAPLAVPAYILNYKVLDDQKQGLGAMQRRSRHRNRIAELRARLADNEIHGDREELAMLLFEEGDYLASLREWKLFMEFDAENLRAQHTASLALMKLGKFAEAEPHLAFVVETSLRYANGRAALDLIELYTKLNRAAEALALSTRLRADSRMPAVVLRHAEVLAASGDTGAARKELDALIAERGDPGDALSAEDREALAAARRLRERLK